MQAVKDMVADLSALIDAHNRGEDTDERFREFMDKHGQFFPDDPQSIEELIDSLARRAAAQERHDGRPLARAAGRAVAT